MIILYFAQQLQITPLPVKQQVVSDAYIYVDSLKWNCKVQQKDCTNLLKDLQVFYNLAFFPKGTPTPPQQQQAINQMNIVLVTIETPKSPMTSNESYQIETNTSGIFITAYDLFALSRALATVAQLIVERPGDEYKEGFYSIQTYSIEDEPAFQYRMFMVDTSRHFLPLNTIKRQLNAMAVSKLNVFHIHLIDTQSNSFNPTTKPADEFAKANFNNGGTYFYSVEDMREIGRYAHSLGIFVKAEFDMPGHAKSWRLANPNLVANCPSRDFSSVNPVNEQLYKYIEAYIVDLLDALYKPYNQDPLIHLGGDEVDHNCWNEDQEISKYMKQNGLNTKTLWQQFHKRIADLINKLSDNKATRFYWQESYNNNNDFSNAIVHSWYDQKVCGEAARQGIKSIRSTSWYLNSQQPGQNRYLFVESMWDFYNVDPAEGIPSDLQKFSLGGGPCQWGEFVNDGNIDEQVWPRSVAAAEVLWSRPSSRAITQQLKERMNTFVCKLLAVGVNSGPIITSAPCPGNFDGIRPE